MKKTMKSYLVFTSRLYRLVMFVLLPAAWAGICLWQCSRMGSRSGSGILIEAALLLSVAETISDSWLFAGIQTLSPARLDYLKTSGRGRGVIGRALTADMVRKLISSAGILFLSYACIGLSALLSGGGKEGLPAGFADGVSGPWAEAGGIGAGLWCLIMLSFFCSALGTFLSRYGTMIWLNIMIAYGVGALAVAALFLPGFFLHPYVYGGGFGLLGLAVSALAVRTAMDRMERSYYDQWPPRRWGRIRRKEGADVPD